MNKSICEECNSALALVREGNSYKVECSYCGIVVDKGFVLDGFIGEHDTNEES